MSNHKIAGLLITMAASDKVIREFAQYIKDAHPDNVVHLTALVRYAMKKEDLNNDDFDKEKVFRVLFPKEEYRPFRMKEIYAKGVMMAKKFHMYRALDKREDIQNFLLAQSFAELQLESSARKVLEQNLTSLPDEEQERYAISNKTRLQIYFSIEKNLEEKKDKRHHLIAALREKEIEWTIAKLKLCCEIKKRKLLLGEEYEDDVREMMDRVLADIPYQDEIHLIDILTKTKNYLTNLTFEDYKILKTSYLAVLDDLHSEKKEVLLHLFNALPLVDIEDRHGEYFDLFKLGVEKGYFLEKGEISPVNFNNIVRVACLVNEYAWAEAFIKSHTGHLRKPPELIENILRMNRCFLLVGYKKHNEALGLLDDVIVEDYSYALNKYVIRLKCIYEIKGNEGRTELLKILNAYRGYVNYKVKQGLLSEALSKQIFNFIKVFTKIVDYKYKNHTKEKLLSLIDAYKGRIIEAQWLKEKTRQLKRY